MIGSFITTHLLVHHVSCGAFCWNIKSPRLLSPPTAQILYPETSDFSPKLKSPLRGKRFQTIDEIQENIMGQLMANGRTMWGPKVLTLKGTEASLSCVLCFLYLVSSSVNVSVFHSTWLTTFWTDLIYAFTDACFCCRKIEKYQSQVILWVQLFWKIAFLIFLVLNHNLQWSDLFIVYVPRLTSSCNRIYYRLG